MKQNVSFSLYNQMLCVMIVMLLEDEQQNEKRKYLQHSDYSI